MRQALLIVPLLNQRCVGNSMLNWKNLWPILLQWAFTVSVLKVPRTSAHFMNNESI
uniref:Uncharacterized protein n=1 Tax=Anguilla anguilla TaxID=7936 RepID=A0A0E9WB68_ANGAN